MVPVLTAAPRRAPGCPEPPPPTRHDASAGWPDRAHAIWRIQECDETARGRESYEICLTNKVTVHTGRSTSAYYRAPSPGEPRPLRGAPRFGDVAVLSASPERFLSIDLHGTVEAKPIKGTRPRGADAAEDRALVAELRDNPKDRAENLMIVDLLRNDLEHGLLGGIGPRAEAVRRRDLRAGAPARLHHPRHTRPGPLGGRLHPRRVPRRVDDRCTQGPHHGDHRRARAEAPRRVFRCARLFRLAGAATSAS